MTGRLDDRTTMVIGGLLPQPGFNSAVLPNLRLKIAFIDSPHRGYRGRENSARGQRTAFHHHATLRRYSNCTWKPLGSSVARQKVRSQHREQVGFVADLKNNNNNNNYCRETKNELGSK